MFIKNKKTEKLLSILDKISFFFYLSGFIYLLFLGTNFFTEDVSVKDNEVSYSFDTDNIEFPHTFNLHQCKLRKNNEELFIEKSFSHLNLESFSIPSEFGKIIHGVLRAPRSDRKQSIGVVFKYRSDPVVNCCSGKDRNGVSGATIVLNFIEYLTKNGIDWLNKDIIFVAIPKTSDRRKDLETAMLWAKTYFNGGHMGEDIPRAGTMISAIVIDIPCGEKYNTFELSTGSKYGSQPYSDTLTLSIVHLFRKNIPFDVFSDPLLYQAVDPFWILKFLQNKFPIEFSSLQNFTKKHLHWRVLECYRNLKSLMRFFVFQSSSSDFLIDADSAFLENGVNAITLRTSNISEKPPLKINFSQDLMKFLYTFTRSFSNSHVKTIRNYPRFALLAKNKIIPFKYTFYLVLLFLSPLYIFLSLYQIVREISFNECLESVQFTVVTYFLGFLLWGLPLIVSLFFDHLLIQYSLISLLTLFLLFIKLRYVFTTYTTKNKENIISLVFGMFGLIMIPFSVINNSLGIALSMCITPLFFHMRRKSKMVKKVLIALEFFFLLNFLRVCSVLNGGLKQFLLNSVKGFVSVGNVHRNPNYFSFFVCALPPLLIFVADVRLQLFFGLERRKEKLKRK